MIIVEGIDRVGKTTYCKELSKFLNIPILTLPRPGEDGLKCSDKFIMGLYQVEVVVEFAILGFNFIIDRSYPSELVYSKVANRETFPEKYYALDRKLMPFASIIYLAPNYTNIYDRWLTAGLDPVNIPLLVEEYKRVLSVLKVKTWTVDPNVGGISEDSV